MNERTETRPAEPRNIYRFGAFVLAVVVGVTSLSARMFYLQVVKGQQADQGANVALTATQSVPSTRGLIYDASGTPLVKNVVTYSVTVTPIDLNLSQKPLVAERLGSLLSTNPVDIETRIDSASGSLYEPVKIADNVPVEVARFIEENSDSLPGVKVVVIQHRQYVTGPLFSELIGYTGQITQAQYDNLKGQGYSTSDVVGQNGLEASRRLRQGHSRVGHGPQSACPR
jgi:penicillin-binding protein 2